MLYDDYQAEVNRRHAAATTNYGLIVLGQITASLLRELGCHDTPANLTTPVRSVLSLHDMYYNCCYSYNNYNYTLLQHYTGTSEHHRAHVSEGQPPPSLGGDPASSSAAEPLRGD